MANISLDIGAVLREIRAMVTSLNDSRAAEKERDKSAQLLVYRALAIHPALESMRPPTGMLADLDWYTELRSPFATGIFRKLGQNEHFRRIALLGTTGTRARIMMLLLWIIGHRLSEDHLGILLSTAVGDAIRSTDDQDGSLASQLVQLDSVKRVLVSLRKMIKTKLPLPPDRNPFVGQDYRIEDENKELPRAELWAYELPSDQQYEFDIRRNPALLLQPLEGRVIIPLTKLSLLVIQWSTCNFGLGKKVFKSEDIDAHAFWNADPPPPPPSSLPSPTWSTSSDAELEFPFEMWEGFRAPPYEIAFDRPLDDWIHVRFCHSYKLHGWAHNSFACVLLFNTFCGSLKFPSKMDILTAVHISTKVQDLLPPEIWNYLEPFIIGRSFLLWKETENRLTQVFETNFAEWSAEERALTAIFSAALRWDKSQNTLDQSPLNSWMQVSDFLIHPSRHCPDALDILSLPLLQAGVNVEDDGEGEDVDDATSLPVNRLPSLDPDTCTCGKCALVSSKMSNSLTSFHTAYVEVTSGTCCNALAASWEPLLTAAEEWLENLISRVESQFSLFAWMDDVRIGPFVLEVANMMNIIVGSELSDQELLRFMVSMSSFSPLDKFNSSVVPKSLDRWGVGYLVKIPRTLDREEYLDEESVVDVVFFARSGWMYDLVGVDGITLIHSREDLGIELRTSFLQKESPVYMPSFKSDTPSIFPPSHDDDLSEARTTQLMPVCGDDELGIKIKLILSSLKADGFPLLSVADKSYSTSTSTPRNALAMCIRVTYLGYNIETVWKPDVTAGTACPHRELWGCMTRCAPTLRSLVERLRESKFKSKDEQEQEQEKVQPLRELSILEALRLQGDIYSDECRQILKLRMDTNSRRLAPLSTPGHPLSLERDKIVFIRCGDVDSQGPVDALVVLGASLKKAVYVLHYR